MRSIGTVLLGHVDVLDNDPVVLENDLSLEQITVIRLAKLHAPHGNVEGGDQFFLVFVLDLEEMAFTNGEQDNRNHEADC